MYVIFSALNFILMKKAALFFASIFISIVGFCQTDYAIAIVPQPVKVIRTTGYFILPKNITINIVRNNSFKTKLPFNCSNGFPYSTGYKVSLTEKASAIIKLELNTKEDTKLDSEGYYLSVTPQNIIIKANKPAGLFYGVQTLMQLFPPEIEDSVLVSKSEWKAPCVEIIDYPRFEWRGLMLDVARHFFTKEEVKKYIDQMAKYKFNVLHWHLADDEGWRVEIKSLPKLTQVGAWRVDRVGAVWNLRCAFCQ